MQCMPSLCEVFWRFVCRGIWGMLAVDNEAQANRRKGDLELLEAGILSRSAIGPGPRAQRALGFWV